MLVRLFCGCWDFAMLISAAKQRRLPENKNEGELESSPTSPEAQKSSLSLLSLSVTDNVINSRTVKRRRRIKASDLSNHDAKRSKHNYVTRKSGSRLSQCKKDFIDNWLSESCWSRSTLIINERLLQELSDNMSPKSANVLPSSGDTFNSAVPSSEKSASSVHDLNYRDSLRYRNIYIQRQKPPVELIRRVVRIISRSRASSETDDFTAQELTDTARRLQDEGEEKIVQQLAPHIIPAMTKIPDQRLAGSADQQWSNFVPVPLDPDVLINLPSLPKPKPDLSFGYSEAAFNHKQLMIIDLLIDDQSKQSYAVLDQTLRFPFLNVEFKSQAKNGTHYVATNQVAGAGAIAMNGNLELIRRSFGAESFDFEEPHFFSVTMDHQLACVNVHWVCNSAEGGQYSFHVEGLSTHVLNKANDIRTLRRAIKNILDHGSDVRLRNIRYALDACRIRFISEREAVTTERDQRNMIQTEPQPEQRRRSRRAQPPSREQQKHQSYMTCK